MSSAIEVQDAADNRPVFNGRGALVLVRPDRPILIRGRCMVVNWTFWQLHPGFRQHVRSSWFALKFIWGIK